MAPEKNMRNKLASDMACEAFQFFLCFASKQELLNQIYFDKGSGQQLKGNCKRISERKRLIHVGKSWCPCGVSILKV